MITRKDALRHYPATLRGVLGKLLVTRESVRQREKDESSRKQSFGEFSGLGNFLDRVDFFYFPGDFG